MSLKGNLIFENHVSKKPVSYWMVVKDLTSFIRSLGKYYDDKCI